MRLEDVKTPQDIKNLSQDELADLARQIRETLVTTVAERGGHLASNLGIVELTLAIHRVFDVPDDKLIFDVGHQSYVHKLLTGRYWRFHTLRAFGGISGFPKRSESPYDVFDAGHASTAISAGLGMARARDLLGEKHQVICVVGDGAMTGGMCYEALNDAGSTGTKMIVILNDNEMSIAPNVGALSSHLTDLRISKGWTSTKRRVKTQLEKIPKIGVPLYRFVHRAKSFLKSLVVPEGFFTSLKFHYFGPVDGHNEAYLEHILQQAKGVDGPCLIHVITQKGHGYDKAEEQPERFHGVPPFYVETGNNREVSTLPSFGSVMAEELIRLAGTDRRVVAVTAAMAQGTGMDRFGKQYGNRLFDVGIAEEHAVTMASGMAATGLRPYVAIYATFFQRAYDQLIHDTAMQHLPVVFLLDRAGLVGEDGATHHGIFDLAETMPVPGLTILAPRDLEELRLMMRWTPSAAAPVVIRYGRKPVDLEERFPCRRFVPGTWEVLLPGADCVLLAVGSMVREAVSIHDILAEEGIRAAVVNCSTVKPLDEGALRAFADRPVFTLEEHVLTGGFGSAVTGFLVAEELPPPVITFGLPDTFIQHGSRGQLLRYLGLMPEQMARRIRVALSQHPQQGMRTSGD